MYNPAAQFTAVTVASDLNAVFDCDKAPMVRAKRRKGVTR
jgi:hypothetical protein